MNYKIIPFSEEYVSKLKSLSDKNKDVLKPNTKMLYFIVARLFTKVSFIALEGLEVVGFIVSFQDGKRIWLHQLAVDKKYRGQGIAKSLIRQLEYVSTNCTIEFSVKEDNYSAIALYEKLGYTKNAYNPEIDQIMYHKKC